MHSIVLRPPYSYTVCFRYSYLRYMLLESNQVQVRSFISFKIVLLLLIYVCVWICWRRSDVLSNFFKLELQTVVSCLWVLGIELLLCKNHCFISFITLPSLLFFFPVLGINLRPHVCQEKTLLLSCSPGPLFNSDTSSQIYSGRPAGLELCIGSRS